MKRTAFLVLLCLCLILGTCLTTALAADVIEISTKDQLMALVSYIAADTNKYQGKIVRLKNDIDLGGETWTPIDTFKGEFDGNGKTIRNFKINAGNSKVGFFVTLSGSAYVHDLTLQNVTGTVGSGRFGTLAYNYSGASLKNVLVKNVNVTTTKAGAWVAGMVARANGSAKGCTVEALKVSAASGVQFVGGFTCLVDGSRTIENCSVKGFVLDAPEATYPLGGFLGQTQVNSNHSTFKNCHVSGIDFTISGTSADLAVGGFFGCPGSFITAENCTTEGKIDASGASADLIGGFMGNLGWGGTYNFEALAKHSLTNCTADVDIVSGGAVTGGFIGKADAGLNYINEGDTKQATFTNCKATGNVTNANGIAGGFVGMANRGEYINCTAFGLVSGKTAGGFIGEADDWKPTYDISCKVNAFTSKFSHEANQIKLSGCKAVGTVLGTEKAGGLIGNVGKSLNGTAKEGAAGELIVTNCTAAPAVIGAKKSTQVAPYLNSTADSKTTKMDKLSGKRTTANPTDSSKALAMDQNGNVTIPEGGADVQHTDDPELKWIPAGSIIHRDGSITLPGEKVADEVTAVTPPRTGVDSADRFIPMALLSLLCMAVLVTLRRKERRS